VRIFSRHGNESTRVRFDCVPDVRKALGLDDSMLPNLLHRDYLMFENRYPG
jgi:hypothetical protein